MSKVETFTLGENNDVLEFYGDDFNPERLILHRNMFLDIAKQKNFNVNSLNDIFSVASSDECSNFSELLPEFYKFLRMIHTIPVTSCTCERSFSNLRRLKTYLRSTMSQKRLNNVAILHAYKERMFKLNINHIADEFMNRTAVRRNTFSLENSNK